MRFTAVSISFLLLAGAAGAQTLQFVPEGTEIDRYTMAAGLVVIANPSDVAIEFSGPSYDRHSLWYTVEHRDSTTVCRAAGECGNIRRPHISLRAGGEVYLPVMLMKSGGAFLFGEPGRYSIAVEALIEYADGRADTLVSEPVAIQVREADYAERWKEKFDQADTVMLAFYPYRSVLHLEEFAGTPAHTTYLLYQEAACYVRNALQYAEFTPEKYRDRLSGLLVEGRPSCRLWEYVYAKRPPTAGYEYGDGAFVVEF